MLPISQDEKLIDEIKFICYKKLAKNSRALPPATTVIKETAHSPFSESTPFSAPEPQPIP